MIELDSELSNNDLPPLEKILTSKGRIKILKVLAKEGELHTTQIAERTKLNYAACSSHLKKLVEYNVVQEKVFGKVRIYRFRIEEIKVRAMKNFFELWELDDSI
ncbi:MAG: winged helix-turn-helix domain-containing protein [Candidatus Hodarchaeota archaeon]